MSDEASNGDESNFLNIFRPINLGRPHERQIPLKLTTCPFTGEIILEPIKIRSMSSKSPYELWYKRRKGIYYRLNKLSAIGNAGNVKRGKVLVGVVKQALSEIDPYSVDCEPHKINKFIIGWIKEIGCTPRHRSTICRALKKLIKNRNATK